VRAPALEVDRERREDVPWRTSFSIRIVRSTGGSRRVGVEGEARKGEALEETEED
jgi:hypothetical protein